MLMKDLENPGLLVCNETINFYTPPVKLENCTYAKTQEPLTRTLAVGLNLVETGKRAHFIETITWNNSVCEPAWNMRYPVDGVGKALLERRQCLHVCLQRGGARKSAREQIASERLMKPPAQLPSLAFMLCMLLAGRVSKKQATNLFLVVQFSCVQANKTLMRPLVTTIKVALGNKSNLRTVSPVPWNNL